MSRLYTVMATAADLAQHFDAEAANGLEVPADNVEGTSGPVVIERDGRRYLRSFSWGFPRRAQSIDEPRRIGLVADLTNPLWARTVADPRFRCLIPLTHFAYPDGKGGKKTRAWFSLADQSITAWAGFCRNTPDYGPVYAGMTMEANEAIPPTNDRMPVLLAPHEYDQWLHGSIQDMIRFQFRAPVAAERMIVERTEERWRSGGLPQSAGPQASLL